MPIKTVSPGARTSSRGFFVEGVGYGVVELAPEHPPCKLVAKPGCWEIGFRQISRNIQILYHK